MEKWQKHSDSFYNFIGRYKEIRPSNDVSNLNVIKEE